MVLRAAQAREVKEPHSPLLPCVEQGIGGEIGIAGETASQPAQTGFVARGYDVRHVHLATPKFVELLGGDLRGGVRRAGNREAN